MSPLPTCPVAATCMINRWPNPCHCAQCEAKRNVVKVKARVANREESCARCSKVRACFSLGGC